MKKLIEKAIIESEGEKERKREEQKLLSNQINNVKYAVIIRKAGALTRYFIIVCFR